VVISFNNPDWDEIRRLGLEWLFIDETPDERLLSAIVQRIVDMPVGQTLPIKDAGKIPYILEANRSGLCYKSLEIDTTAMTITKVREARVKRAFIGDVEQVQRKIR